MEAASSKVRWATRVSPGKIERLYQSDAAGMLDEELLDEVGYGIYARCQDRLELNEAQRGRVRCRECGHVIVRDTTKGRFDEHEVLRCSKCSWQVRCADYHVSLLRKTSAPPWEGERLLRSFVRAWPDVHPPPAKLLLIDGLIHEFHIQYRAVGTPVGCTVIEATTEGLIELLERLAYGPASTPGILSTRTKWSLRLKAKRQMPTMTELRSVARGLGAKRVKTRNRRELVDEIERLDPGRLDSLVRAIDLTTHADGEAEALK